METALVSLIVALRREADKAFDTSISHGILLKWLSDWGVGREKHVAVVLLIPL